MKSFVSRLAAQFGNKEFAHSYMEGHAITRVAAQIHALRKQRGWTQEELSRRSGIAQARISKIESADFESLTLSTLRKFAEAFDVHVKVAFEGFSEGIMDVANLKPEMLEVSSRVDDLADLCDRRVLEIGQDNWKAVPNALVRVTAIPLTPVMPESSWQAMSPVGLQVRASQ